MTDQPYQGTALLYGSEGNVIRNWRVKWPPPVILEVPIPNRMFSKSESDPLNRISMRCRRFRLRWAMYPQAEYEEVV